MTKKKKISAKRKKALPKKDTMLSPGVVSGKSAKRLVKSGLSSSASAHRPVKKALVNKKTPGSLATDFRKKAEALITSRARYFDFYELSPVGYLTLGDKGLILEANLTVAALLGMARGALIKQPLTRFILPEDQNRFHRFSKQLAKKGEPQTVELRLVREDSIVFWAQLLLISSRTDEYSIALSDISIRKKSVETLHIKEQLLIEAQRVGQIGSWDWDATTDTIIWSDEYCHIFGLDPKLPVPNYIDHLKLYTPESSERLDAVVKKALQNEEPYELDLELSGPGSRTRWICAHGEIKKDASGHIIGLRGTAQNITERKRVEEEKRCVEERFRNLVESTNDWVWEVDEHARYTYASPKIKDLLGYEPEEVLGKTPFDFMRHEEASRVAGIFGPIAAAQKPFVALENTNFHKDGHPVVIETSAAPFFDSNRNFRGYRGIDRDITARKRADNDIQKQRKQIEAFFDHTITSMAFLDKAFNFIRVNKAYADAGRRDPSEFPGHNHFEYYPSDAKAIFEEVVRTKTAFQTFARPFTYADHPEWGITYWDWTLVPILDNKGEVEFLVFSLVDVTKGKKTEELIKNILESVDEGFLIIDPEYKIISANRAYCEQAGKPLESILGRHCYETSHHATMLCHEPEHICGCKRTFETGEPAFTVHTHTDDKGKQIQVEIKTYAMKDESGKVQSVIEVIYDITEKRALERQLQHAQKMEGIGTLAGGIAHDFNNILSAIIGYGHVTLMKMPQDDPLRMNIEHMLESADRAAALTQSLLTFSRTKITERKPVDLNKILKKVEKFLVRVIGEDVVVSMVLAEGELTVFADAGQLEQVFMNLATNARDAMPSGGSFMIETSIIELDNGFISTHGYGKPGTYAMISATDTGVGMNEETKNHIFEPFFTTKEVGKGTGLGLAMVYGIVKQHEGFINVYSEPGKGTTFRIYLPLITSEAEDEKSVVISEYPKGGTETILLAEDDENLRKLTVIVLEQMGYTVITANDGEEAVTKFIENKNSIQLLIFDIIMPKKNGKEAYDEIRKVSPKVPVLFESGYSPDMLREKTLIEEGAAIIYKPMSPHILLKKIRELLDQSHLL